MMQHLLYPSLQDQARRVGGRAEIERTADAVVYKVTGPASELSYLSRLLVGVLDPPAPAADAVLRADREMREERLAEWETAAGHVRSSLRAQLFPADVSVAGTDRSATRFSTSSLPSIWARMYDPARISVVAVGDVYLADLEREFANLPARRTPAGTDIQRDSILLTSLAPAEATQAWLAAAYLANDLPPAEVNVAVRLLGGLLRLRVPTAQVQAEHWWTHHGQAVVLMASVPQADLALARRTVSTAITTLLPSIDFLSVSEAATLIRREVLFYSRTPDRMADLLGLFVDRGGDPNAADIFYDALDAVDDKGVRDVLQKLSTRTPARIEISPQILRPRQP